MKIIPDATRKFFFLSAFFVLTLSACAGGLNYKKLNNYIKDRNCSEAVEYVKQEEENYGRNMKLLFLLDSGMVSMQCRNYKESNINFHRAEELAEDLWTKSVTKEAASFLLNDYTIPYAGEDFERTLINLLSAINYAMLGEYDESLVECRRLDANLLMFNRKYEKKNVYKEDAFGRYLSGIIYESTGETEDAFIDYYKAFNVYRDYAENYGTPLPSLLIKALLRAAEATDRMDEVLPDIKNYDSIRWIKHQEARKLGKIVFIHFNGKAPVKMNNKVSISTNDGPITIAFPTFEIHPPSCKVSGMLVRSVSKEWEAGTELVEDINSIAVKNLGDRKARVIAKTIARTVVKQLLINTATDNKTVKLLYNIVNTAIERADTRSWRTLPGEIYLTSMFLPAGEYNVYGTSCGIENEVINKLDLKLGETRFVLFKTMY